MERRFCPLCDEHIDAEFCPKHGVPGIVLSSAGSSPPRLTPGLVIGGRYRIDRELGRGGMAGLWLATQLGMERRVVVKVIADDTSLTRRHALKRIYQEACAVSRLSHPNIVRVFEFAVDAPTQLPFLAMEYVEGRTLHQVINDDGPLPERRAAEVFRQITRGLMEAHKQSVVHRDLKPANIMITVLDDGTEHAQLLDFGIARLLHADPLTAPGKIVGTPWYMSPEQISEGAQDFRTDLYGLGCILHAALTGAPPFPGEDVIGVMKAQLREPPPPLPLRLSDGRPPSKSLQTIYGKLLAKSRLDRPDSTLEVVRMFAELTQAREEADPTEPVAVPSQSDRSHPPWGEATIRSTEPSPDAFSEAATLRPPKEHDASIGSADTLRAAMLPIDANVTALPAFRDLTAVMPQELREDESGVALPATISQITGPPQSMSRLKSSSSDDVKSAESRVPPSAVLVLVGLAAALAALIYFAIN